MGLLSHIHTRIRNLVNKVVRPAAVTRAQHEHVKQFPACAACGATESCQGHHVRPYHKFPELAANPSNFITLCEHPGGPECHLHVGHGGSFRFFNSSVVADAARMKAAETDADRQLILAEIKANRQPDVP